ncbi:MAG: protein-L-isoaspartate O-methyltransferase [Alphaproteobacteria bacterium]
MIDFAPARTNMVTNQIRPNKVTDERVLAALAAVPRERFVPEVMSGNAYVDDDIAVAPGRYLMEPMVFARLLQAAAIEPDDVVLDIGCATGYSASVLCHLAATVVALESDETMAETAIALLTGLKADGSAVVSGELAIGYGDQAPYDVIVIEGAVETVPEVVVDQLVEGGRLVAVVTGGERVGKAMLILRSHGVVSRRVLFDAAIPPLPGFESAPAFVF